VHQQSSPAAEPATDPLFPPDPRPTTAAFVLLVLIPYILITTFVAAHHEPWRDEADPWLVARDASLPQLFHLTGRIGTPALWYLILMPFAKLGFPYPTMQAIHLCLATAATAVFLAKAPLPKSIRVLTAFGIFLSYEYAIITRTYVLTVLFLFAIAARHPKRLTHPLSYAALVFLLFNANPHSFFLAGLITLIYFDELLTTRSFHGRPLAALALMLSGALLAFLQLLPPPHPQLPGWLTARTPDAFDYAIGHSVLVPFPVTFIPYFPEYLEDRAFALNLAILAGCTLLLLRRPKALLLFYASTACLLYIFVYKWFGELRHAGLIFLMLLFCLWTARDEPERQWLVFAAGSSADRADRFLRRLSYGALLIGLAFSCLAAAVEWTRDVRYPYSTSRQVAQFLRANNLDLKPIAATFEAESILPYLRCHQFWYADTQRYGSYGSWDRTFVQNRLAPPAELMSRVTRHFPPRQRPLIIFRRPAPDPEQQGYRPIPTAPDFGIRMTDEAFFLYEPIPPTP